MSELVLTRASLPSTPHRMPGLLYPLVYGPKFSARDIPSMDGKICLVTGGNIGIGYETVKELVRKGAHVYLAARSQHKAEAAIKSINNDLDPKVTGKVEFLELDLQSLESTKKAAERFSSREGKLDVLINNAGIMAAPYKLTIDGFEQQFQTNHLAPFLFTHLLLPKLNAASSPRYFARPVM